MEILVEVTDWEQACCGSRVMRGARVAWQLFVPMRPVADTRESLPYFIESHHDLLTNGATVDGRVLKIRAVGRVDSAESDCELLFKEIEQIWSPANQEPSEYRLDFDLEGFLVNLEVADIGALPKEPSTSA